MAANLAPVIAKSLRNSRINRFDCIFNEFTTSLGGSMKLFCSGRHSKISERVECHLYAANENFKFFPIFMSILIGYIQDDPKFINRSAIQPNSLGVAGSSGLDFLIGGKSS